MKTSISAVDANSTSLLTEIRNGNASAVEDLRELLAPGLTLLLRRRLSGKHVTEAVEAVLAGVLKAIQQDEERDGLSPIRTIARMTRDCLTEYAREYAVSLPGEEARALPARAAETIERLTTVEKQAVVRYYQMRHDPKRICSDLNLTPKQFDRLRSRLRADFLGDGAR